ncbi:hypothetical protein FHS27_000636 [Rhodopirellula rubra]|uniref:Uncharacterized protein n=1 Tax=Aporhodopirellula rubra TaxID=980271 RepID=A0A7W5DUM9_9BACT|nr:hypothetical protein [Aporhodopirellula rubra]
MNAGREASVSYTCCDRSENGAGEVGFDQRLESFGVDEEDFSGGEFVGEFCEEQNSGGGPEARERAVSVCERLADLDGEEPNKQSRVDAAQASIGRDVLAHEKDGRGDTECHHDQRDGKEPRIFSFACGTQDREHQHVPKQVAASEVGEVTRQKTPPLSGGNGGEVELQPSG